jgi:hypothetical protein
MENKKINKIFIAIFTILIGLIAATIILSPTGCATESCFIKSANKCQSAIYKNVIQGIEISYETNNCVLKKMITKVPGDDPEQVKKEFIDKAMYCRYARGDFSGLYLKTLSGMLYTCEGPLKDAISGYSF